jgi:hypothetical protein
MDASEHLVLESISQIYCDIFYRLVLDVITINADIKCPPGSTSHGAILDFTFVAHLQILSYTLPCCEVTAVTVHTA